jgi:hypothetical protein
MTRTNQLLESGTPDIAILEPTRVGLDDPHQRIGLSMQHLI